MNKKSFNLKKSFILQALFFCLFLLFSCKNQLEDTNDSETTGNYSSSSSESVGFINLTLNSPDSDNLYRSAIPVEAAIEKSTLYEILIYNETGITTFTYDKEESTIEIPTGTWNLVVLAGQKLSKKSYIVGSGYAENFTIQENQITELAVNIMPVDITITAPDEVYLGEKFNVGFSIDTRNPHLTVASLHVSCITSTAADSTTSSTSLKANTSAQAVSMEKEYTAPNEPKNLLIKFSTCEIHFVDEAFNIDSKIDDNSSFDRLINSDIYDQDGITTKTINSVKKVISTGINIGMTWVD